MKKQIDFNLAKEERLDEQITKTMQRDFTLPQQVEAAKNSAFAQIREKACRQEYANGIARKARKRKYFRSVITKGAAGLTAAVACFSVACIANPALAANIPLVGHVFESIGQTLGFSGDYSKYAEPLAEAEQVSETESESAKSVTEKSGVYTKTVDGVTVTLSEIYCNDAAMNISMLIESEKPFPETMEGQDGKPLIDITSAKTKFSYNPEEIPGMGTLYGKFVDQYTFAGVWRIDLQDTTAVMDNDAYYKAYDAFYAEILGISEAEVAKDREAAAVRAEEAGVEVYDEQNSLNTLDYISQVEVPDEFAVELDIDRIVGMKPDCAIPEMPQELLDEYQAGLEENGLGGIDLNDPDIYENLTDEQKQIEHELFTKMHQEYAEKYPEAAGYPNEYENWWYDGPWSFEIDVTKNHEDTIVKDLNDIDESGLGIVSVTKTPFEITVETQEPELSQAPSGAGYFVVALDADGDIMPYGGDGNVNVWAIQDRDISKIDIYLCDYIEYMDELKGYYWSDTYKTDKETKTFKQLLDERALYHTEVTFEE